MSETDELMSMEHWWNDTDTGNPKCPDKKETSWRPPQTSHEVALDLTGPEPYPFKKYWVTFSAENISTQALMSLTIYT